MEALPDKLERLRFDGLPNVAPGCSSTPRDPFPCHAFVTAGCIILPLFELYFLLYVTVIVSLFMCMFN